MLPIRYDMVFLDPAAFAWVQIQKSVRIIMDRNKNNFYTIRNDSKMLEMLFEGH